MIKTFFVIIEKLILIALIMLLYPMYSHGQVPTGVSARHRYAVPKEVVREKIAEHISEKSGLSSEDINIGDFSYRKIFLPNENYSLLVEDIFTKQSSRRSYFLLNFNMENGHSRRVKVAVPVKVKRMVLKLGRNFRKGDTLLVDEIEESEDWINYRANNVVTDLSNLLGKRFNRTVKANSILRKGMVSEEFFIKKGDIISIVAQKNGLLITAKGVAHRDGKVGHMITVINLASNKIIQGRVLDKNSVMAEF